MDLEGLLKHAIDAGWIGKQSIMGLGIGEITVNGDEATAVATTPTQATATQAPGAEAASELRYRFVREQGEWRFGFRSLVESINQMIAQLTKQMGTDQDALIFVLVEQLSGRKVLPEVWSLPSGSAQRRSPRGARRALRSVTQRVHHDVHPDRVRHLRVGLEVLLAVSLALEAIADVGVVGGHRHQATIVVEDAA